jgi:hypothetical protein
MRSLATICSCPSPSSVRVRRYGANAALDDEPGLGRVPPMPLIYAFAEKQAEYALAHRALRPPEGLREIMNSHDTDAQPTMALTVGANGKDESKGEAQ